MATNEISGLVHRVNLMFPAPAQLAFIAARSGEGTSTVARDFAIGLAAETDRKSLIIDAGPLDKERFAMDGINPANGLIEAVAAGRPAAEASHVIDYNVSLSRWMGQESNRALANRTLHEKSFWDELHKTFDTIVIDAPSPQSSPDGITLAARAGAVILVIEAEATRQPVIENLRAALSDAGAKVIGSVMNKRRLYIPEKIYARL